MSNENVKNYIKELLLEASDKTDELLSDIFNSDKELDLSNEMDKDEFVKKIVNVKCCINYARQSLKQIKQEQNELKGE